MGFVDVVFPQNVGALTYRVPGGMAVSPGMLVGAEIRRSVKRGVVLREQPRPPGGKLKEISSVESDGPVLSDGMLRLISWMAEYYFALEGQVLKSMLPREFFDRVKARKPPPEVAEARSPYAGGLGGASPEALADVRKSAQQGCYRTFLYHAPSVKDEFAFALEAIKGLRGVIVLVPEHTGIKSIEGALKRAAGDRLVLYHGGLARGARSDAIEKIVSGSADVVLGSRSAVFAPLRDVSLIVVLHEENTAYKADSGVRYGARDMAVMRGYQEGAAVLLASICPSVESWHNCRSGKYSLIQGRRGHLRPEVRVVDMRRARGAISRKLREAAASRIRKGQRVMFVINRRGYSMLQCADCQGLIDCTGCGVPLVFYKSERKLRCSYCGLGFPAPTTCPSCGGLLEAAGSGIERVMEELQELKPSGVDRSAALRVLSDTGTKLVVGTGGLARKEAGGEGFSLSAVLNADSYRYVPDFRSAERAFQEFLYVSDKTAPGGQLFLQSMNPRAPLFSHLRKFDFRRFYEAQLGERRELGYPPYSRMVLVTVSSAAAPDVAPGSYRGVDVLGPVPAITKRGKKVQKILLRSASRAALRAALGKLLAGLPAPDVTVDVDPIWV